MRVHPDYREALECARANRRILLDFLEQSQVDYIIGMAENKVLKRRARRLMGKARRRSKESGKTANVFGETSYAARTWKDKKCRVLIKAEGVRLEGREPKDNARFVPVRSLPVTMDALVISTRRYCALELLRGSAIHYSSGFRHNWQVVLIESGNFVKIG